MSDRCTSGPTSAERRPTTIVVPTQEFPVIDGVEHFFYGDAKDSAWAAPEANASRCAAKNSCLDRSFSGPSQPGVGKACHSCHTHGHSSSKPPYAPSTTHDTPKSCIPTLLARTDDPWPGTQSARSQAEAIRKSLRTQRATLKTSRISNAAISCDFCAITLEAACLRLNMLTE